MVKSIILFNSFAYLQDSSCRTSRWVLVWVELIVTESSSSNKELYRYGDILSLDSTQNEKDVTDQIVANLFSHPFLQEKSIDVLLAYYPLEVHLKSIDVQVFIQSLAKKASSITLELVFVEMTTLPDILSHQSFTPVVNVVCGGREDFVLLDFEGAEHRVGSQVDAVDEEILVGSKTESSLPDFSVVLQIYYVVRVDACPFFLSSICRPAQEDEVVGFDFPSVVNQRFYFVLMTCGCYRVRKSIEPELSLPLLDIVSLELESVIVPRLIPHHHRIVVSLFCHMLVSPLVVFGLVAEQGFGCFLFVQLEGVGEIGQFVSGVVVSPSFLETEVFCLGEGSDIALIRFFIHELEGEIGK